MTQILDLIPGRRRPEEPETSVARERLQKMLQGPAVAEAPAGDVAGGWVDLDANNESCIPDHEPVASDDGEVATSPMPDEAIDDIRQDAAPERAESHEVPSDDTAADVENVEDDDIAGQEARLDSVAAFRAVVSQAQQDVETQLMAVVERVQTEAAEQHAIELARVTEASDTRRDQAVAEARAAAETELARVCEERDRRHAEELRQVREDAQAEITAAIERDRTEAAERHVAELALVTEAADARREQAVAEARAAAEAESARACEELKRERIDDLQRASSVVLESFEALMARIR